MPIRLPPDKVDRSASAKFTQSILDTPRTITAIPKEVIEDKGAMSLRELVRTTPGLTLGTGEGGNTFATGCSSAASTPATTWT